MNKLIERLIKVPLPTKIVAVAVALAALTAANYFVFIRDLETQIARSEADLRRLNKDLVDKKVIADNLNQYRRDKEVLERRLAEALTELPLTADIDELLRQLNDVGKKSGLEIVNLEPGVETPSGFYASIPIKMQVSGNYHEIAVFFESVSKLRRIVNISNLAFTSPQRKNEKVVLGATYLATTFRFVEQSAEKPPKK
jgi:type IV pilus assembly protein PilO